MKSDPQYIGINEAAVTLDTTPDRIRWLCSQGLVRRTSIDGDPHVRLDDIEEITERDLLGELRPGELVKRMLLLEKKVERLEGALDLLYQVSELSASRFPYMVNEDLLRLYSMVEDELEQTCWETDKLISLGDMLVKVTEVEIERLNALLRTDQSWGAFHQLSIQLTRYVGSHPEIDSSAELQRARELLHAARKNLRTVGALFIEKSNQLGPSRTLLERTAAVDVEGFDILVRQLKSTCPPGKMKLT